VSVRPKPSWTGTGEDDLVKD